MHLSTRNNWKLLNYGFMQSGNDMIARTLIRGVSESLKEDNDIIVGVMWSGKDRHAVFNPDMPNPASDNFAYGPRNFIDTPVDVHHPKTVSLRKGGWLNFFPNLDAILDHPWLDLSSLWYKNYNNKIYSDIMTLENILQAQTFLELHNIDYFMSGFMDDTLQFKLNKHTQWLYDLINWDKFITVGMLEWCESRNYIRSETDRHPTDAGSLEYTKQIIEPHLKERELL